MEIDLSKPSPERDRFIQITPAHFRPIIEAVQHYGVGLVVISPGQRRFEIPRWKGPTIFVVGDDGFEARGPDAFHKASVGAVAKRAMCMALLSSEAVPLIYQCAASWAAIGRIDVIIIETQPLFESPWLEFVYRHHPNMPGIIGTVAGGRA